MSSNPPVQPPAGVPQVHIPERLGFKVLTLGGTGNGKTTAIKTIAKRKKVFVLFAENGMAALADTDPQQVHWKYIPAAPADFRGQKNMAEMINRLDRKQIAAYDDPNRQKHKQFVEVFAALENLRCDRTGETFGPVEKLDQDWVFVLDSISGISVMAKQLVGGTKPVFDKGEWFMAMERIEYMIQNLCMSIPCHVIVNAHEEREEDEINQGTKIMVSVLGKKLAPKIPRFFDDVIYAYRNQNQWLWSTNYPTVADLKSRHLGIFHAKEQNFGAILDAWEKGK